MLPDTIPLFLIISYCMNLAYANPLNWRRQDNVQQPDPTDANEGETAPSGFDKTWEVVAAVVVTVVVSAVVATVIWTRICKRRRRQSAMHERPLSRSSIDSACQLNRNFSTTACKKEQDVICEPLPAVTHNRPYRLGGALNSSRCSHYLPDDGQAPARSSRHDRH